MDVKKIKVVAMDLDGTLTQHRQPIPEATKKALDQLAERYHLLMVGAGQVGRIHKQMGFYPIDIVGNYGMQYARYSPKTGEMEFVRDLTIPVKDRAEIEEKVALLRKTYGYETFAGDGVEYHPSGCITIPLLGTQAKHEDKIAFDPDRKKRRAFYDHVKRLFPEYTVFVGGSSSFDMAPLPYNKCNALETYCRENGLEHENVVFIGDDYGLGGNDESVYVSDFPFLTVDDYRDFPKVAAKLLED